MSGVGHGGGETCCDAGSVDVDVCVCGCLSCVGSDEAMGACVGVSELDGLVQSTSTACNGDGGGVLSVKDGTRDRQSA